MFYPHLQKTIVLYPSELSNTRAETEEENRTLVFLMLKPFDTGGMITVPNSKASLSNTIKIAGASGFQLREASF